MFRKVTILYQNIRKQLLSGRQNKYTDSGALYWAIFNNDLETTKMLLETGTHCWTKSCSILIHNNNHLKKDMREYCLSYLNTTELIVI